MANPCNHNSNGWCNRSTFITLKYIRTRNTIRQVYMYMLCKQPMFWWCWVYHLRQRFYCHHAAIHTHTHRTKTAQRIIPTRLPVSVLFHWRRIQKNTFCNVQLSEIIFEIITIIFSECSFLYFSFFSSSIAAVFLSSACIACSVCLVGCG